MLIGPYIFEMGASYEKVGQGAERVGIGRSAVPGNFVAMERVYA